MTIAHAASRQPRTLNAMKTSRLVPLLGTVLAVVALAACSSESESLKQANVIYNETLSCAVDAATHETITLWTLDDEALTYEPGSDHYVAARERCRTLSPGLFDGSWPAPTSTPAQPPVEPPVEPTVAEPTPLKLHPEWGGGWDGQVIECAHHDEVSTHAVIRFEPSTTDDGSPSVAYTVECYG